MITVDGHDHAWWKGMTVADLLSKIDNSGHCAVVRLNDRYVSRPNFETTPVPDQSEVLLLPMIAGG